MAGVDRGYTLLLNHLHNPEPTLPFTTIQGVLAHYLATVDPSPTPLSGTAVSAPLYLSQPLTYAQLNSLSTAFRHATHLKCRALAESQNKRSRLGALFRKTLVASMDQWVNDVIKGLLGGRPVSRLVCCTGLLLGVEDLRFSGTRESENRAKIEISRGSVEDEAILSLAEVMDTYAFGMVSGSSSSVEEWEKEFQPAGQDILSLALIFASQSLPLVPQHKLKALPLPILARLLTSTISATFKTGSFLSSISASVTLTPGHLVHISTSSPLVQTLQSISSSPLTFSISTISRFTANVLSLLIDSPPPVSDEALRSVSETFQVLQDMAKAVERDWLSSSLASASDAEIADESKDIAKSVWTTLKTLLFTIIMLSESVLSAAVYIPSYRSWSHITPSSLALQTLHTLSHLSFVISQFGGVTNASKGFEELKKTFYLALDILSQGDGIHGDSGVQAEAYVKQSCIALNCQRTEGNIAFRQAKEAYVLASIEQLVPVLSEKCIRDWVWGVCYPHLSDSSHRETYESSHSVVLSIFASHAQQQCKYTATKNPTETNVWNFDWLRKTKERSKVVGRQAFDSTGGSAGLKTGVEVQSKAPMKTGALATNFVNRMVPFYAKCLIDNSIEGKLNTPQLRLAYSALVRSASAGSSTVDERADETYSLAWYCIQLILDTLQALSAPNQYLKGELVSGHDASVERAHRLHLTLISTISSLPLLLLSRALEDILVILTSPPFAPDDKEKHGGSERRRKELVEALFGEILEGVGDREKEYAMRWWYQHRPALISVIGEEEKEGGKPISSEPKGRKKINKEDLPKQESQSDSRLVSRL